MKHWGIIIALSVVSLTGHANVSFEETVRLNPEQFLSVKEFRRWDGVGNNLHHQKWGAAGTAQDRIAGNDYAEPRGIPSGGPNPRLISNAIHSDPYVGPRAPTEHFAPVTDMFWAWGQFLDHDITLTNLTEVNGKQVKSPIAIPRGDSFFDPEGWGGETMAFSRSKMTRLGNSITPINDTTAFIDASQVYGADPIRAKDLLDRDAQGRMTGYLRYTETIHGALLPYNVNGLDNGTNTLRHIPRERFFIAGDVRANEHVSLNSLHTIFLREHNYLVSVLKRTLGTSPVESYELARAIVAAEVQVITFRDWLPLLIGGDGVGAYPGYDPNLDPGIRVFFSTAAFRFGHSMVSPQIALSDVNGDPIGSLAIRNTFKEKVPPLMEQGYINAVLHGLSRQKARRLDPFITDELRNFLFGLPAPLRLLRRPLGIPQGLDLASLNIMRGRDHGVLRYNAARAAYGLAPVSRFDQINPGMGTQYRATYGTALVPGPRGPVAVDATDSVDSWTAGLSEIPVPGAMVGPLFHRAITDQFIRLRNGDRFWHESYLPPALLAWVRTQSLREIISRNTNVGAVPRSLFLGR